jgi:hypothetical protein
LLVASSESTRGSDIDMEAIGGSGRCASSSVAAGTQPDTTQPSSERSIPTSRSRRTRPRLFRKRLLVRASALEGVVIGDSFVSVPGGPRLPLGRASRRGPARGVSAGRRVRSSASVFRREPAHDASSRRVRRGVGEGLGRAACDERHNESSGHATKTSWK